MNWKENKKVLARIGRRLGRQVEVVEFKGLKRPVGRPRKQVAAFITQSIVNATLGLSFRIDYYNYKKKFVLPKITVISRDDQKLKGTIMHGSTLYKVNFNLSAEHPKLSAFVAQVDGYTQIELGWPLNQQKDGTPFLLQNLDSTMRRIAGAITEWASDMEVAKRAVVKENLERLRQCLIKKQEPSFKERVQAFERKWGLTEPVVPAKASKEPCACKTEVPVAPAAGNDAVTIKFADGSELCVKGKVKVTLESLA